MCAGGCTRLVAVILLLVAALALVVHFIAPYWTFVKGIPVISPSYSTGLWGWCRGSVDIDEVADSLDGCTWFSDDDFKFMKGLPDFHYACQGLATFGIIFLVLAVPVGCGSLCCCKSDRLAYFTGSATIFACFLLAISIAVWGWGMSQDDNAGVVPFKDTSSGRAEWGYYMGIGGVILGWIAGSMFFCSRNKY